MLIRLSLYRICAKGDCSHYALKPIVAQFNSFKEGIAKYVCHSGFDSGSFTGGIFLGFTYVFMPIGMALELIEDREIRAKNQV